MRAYIKPALIFVLGVIVTIGITKFFDKIIPNDPVIVKEYVDTIKIIHEIPSLLNSDSSSELEKKVKNLELLNNYDKQIKERISNIESKNQFAPNLIITNNIGNRNTEGYILRSTSSYFSSECPTLKDKYCDILIDFLNPAVTKDIAYIRVNIYRSVNNNDNAVQSISEELYEVRSTGNLIRINNDFDIGVYEVTYGFILKRDLKEKYPTFYAKKCMIHKS